MSIQLIKERISEVFDGILEDYFDKINPEFSIESIKCEKNTNIDF